jgi:hypothetical protein
MIRQHLIKLALLLSPLTRQAQALPIFLQRHHLITRH